MMWNRNIQGRVLAIARSNANPLRVMAGPGTGKSFAMKRRIARLLEEGVQPEHILAVTFTRTAARQLVEDLHGMGVAGCEKIRCGTLHAFCYRLLRRQGVFEYLGRVARPLITFNKSGIAQFECAPMLEDLCATGDFGSKRDCTSRIRAFEAAWARLQHEDPGWPQNEVDRRFHQALLDWLRFHEAMLIGELVPEALRYLRDNPAAPERQAFDHVIVDEYQDLNKAEQVLLDLLADSGHLCIVGDVDQSIYRFRFANPEGIIEFKQRHPQTQDERLLECYRCPKRVVALADFFIRQNHPLDVGERIKPRPSNPEGEVHIVQWDQLGDEAAGLARFVGVLLARGYAPGDILILSPRRLIGYGIRDALREAGIPVHSFYHEEALEADEAQEAFALLTLLVHRDDRPALRFWLGFGSPSCRAGEYARLRSYCETNDLSPRNALDQIVNGQARIVRTSGIVKRYEGLCQRLDDLQGMSCADLVDRLFPKSAEWATTLREMAQGILNNVSTPKELLDELRNQITQPEMPEEGDFVRVMSLHKSKGLTAKVTIVSGCIEGLIPTVDDDLPQREQDECLREQRRLFYVALTRCREILVLSSVVRLPVNLAHRMGARVRGRRGVCTTIASRFLSELGPTAPQSVCGREWEAGGFG